MKLSCKQAATACATAGVAALTLMSAATTSSAAVVPARVVAANASTRMHVAMPASSFTDSVGVNVHTAYNDTPYGDQQTLVASIAALGVTHIRDGIKVGRSDVVATLQALSAAGIHSDLVMGDPQHRYGVGTIDEEVSLLSGPLAGAVEAAEGPNEWDCSGSPTWDADLHSYQQQLVDALRANATTSGIPAIGPSFCRTASKASYGVDSVSQVANDHDYAGGGPPEATLDSEVASTRASSGLNTLVITETGYHDALAATSGQPGAPRSVAAVYDLRTLLEAFRLGVSRTYLYELYDEFDDPTGTNPEADFGLMDHDGQPKPAYTAVQSMQRLLGDQPGKSLPSLRYGLHAPAAVQSVLLGRTDGSADLVLWQPVSLYNTDTKQALAPASTLVQLSLGTLADLTLAHPAITGTQLVTAGTAVRGATLSVGADPVIVHITPHRRATITPPRIEHRPPDALRSPQRPAPVRSGISGRTFRR